MIETILNSDDRNIHRRLFDWFIDNHNKEPSKNFKEQLLQLSSPYLENYLHEIDLEAVYNYYVRNERNDEAVLVACKISDKNGCPIQKRIEFLSKAIMTMNGVSNSKIDVRELKEKLDVARIQSHIYSAIEASPLGSEPNGIQALEYLNERLFPLSDVTPLPFLFSPSLFSFH